MSGKEQGKESLIVNLLAWVAGLAVIGVTASIVILAMIAESDEPPRNEPPVVVKTEEEKRAESRAARGLVNRSWVLGDLEVAKFSKSRSGEAEVILKKGEVLDLVQSDKFFWSPHNKLLRAINFGERARRLHPQTAQGVPVIQGIKHIDLYRQVTGDFDHLEWVDIQREVREEELREKFKDDPIALSMIEEMDYANQFDDETDAALYRVELFRARGGRFLPFGSKVEVIGFPTRLDDSYFRRISTPLMRDESWPSDFAQVKLLGEDAAAYPGNWFVYWTYLGKNQ